MTDKPKEVLEIERRWILLNPPKFTQDLIDQLGVTVRELDITQMYLLNDHTERIRQTREGEDTVYHHTLKRPAKKAGQWETEKEITAIEFSECMSRLDPALQAIVKKRTVVSGSEEYKYEIDRFAYPIQHTILEVEVPSLDTKVKLPKVIFGDSIEITNEKGLSNYRIAAKPKSAAKKLDKLIEDYLAKKKKKKSKSADQ